MSTTHLLLLTAFMVSCSNLSWLLVCFLAYVNIGLVHRTISYFLIVRLAQTTGSYWQFRQWIICLCFYVDNCV